MKVCVFGSSSRRIAPVYTMAAVDLGRALTIHGHELVFGGYDMGLMGAVASGAAEAGGRITGIVTEGLNARADREVFPCTDVIVTADLAERKERMVEISDAFVTLPGGLGTFDEFFDVLAQVKSGQIERANALLNVAEFYNPLIRMLDDACDQGLNAGDWRAICEVFADPNDLVSWLDKKDAAR